MTLFPLIVDDSQRMTLVFGDVQGMVPTPISPFAANVVNLYRYVVFGATPLILSIIAAPVELGGIVPSHDEPAGVHVPLP